jgi:hypothetical protein
MASHRSERIWFLVSTLVCVGLVVRTHKITHPAGSNFGAHTKSLDDARWVRGRNPLTTHETRSPQFAARFFTLLLRLLIALMIDSRTPTSNE